MAVRVKTRLIETLVMMVMTVMTKRGRRGRMEIERRTESRIRAKMAIVIVMAK